MVKDKVDINKIPSIPPSIIDAVNENKLVVFSGAGISRIKSIGCLGWDQLAKNLIDRCYKEGKINFKERDSLLKTSDHRKIITISYKHFMDTQKPFWDEMKKALKEGKKYKKTIQIPNIYDDIYHLRGINITTNADTHFDRLYAPDNIIYDYSKFDFNNIKRTKIYHLHGSITNPDSMIFTLPKYFQLYQEPNVREFLNKIFSKYIVLFIGYGLGEFELLEYLFLQNSDKNSNQSNRFILIPYYSQERNLVAMDQSYFDDMGITVIAYNKDDIGYEQLTDVIKDWRNQINSRSKYQFDSTKSIDDALANPTKKKILDIIQVIKQEPNKEEYLFRNFSKTVKPHIWFEPLLANSILNPEKIPLPVENKEGYIQQKPWTPLFFIKILIKEFDNINDINIRNKLLELIERIIEYEQNIKNELYSPSYVMPEIIFNIPVKHFTLKYFNYLKFLLRKNSLMVSDGIYKILVPKLIESSSKHHILQLIEILFNYEEIKDKQIWSRLTEYRSIVDIHILLKIISDYSKSIFKVAGIGCYRVIIKKINEIVKNNRSAFNFIRVRTIEDHPQSKFTDRYEYQLIHFTRDILLLINKNEMESILKYLFWRKHPIYKRLAFNTIRESYDELKKYFWSWVENAKNPLNEPDLKHELWNLINQNSAKFSKKEINTLIKWIETKDFANLQKVYDTQYKIEAGIAYRKIEWLLALKGSNNEEVKQLNEEYSRICPDKVVHPGFDIWMGGMELKKTKTIPEDLLKKSNEEIVEFLNKFTGPERYPREGDSVYDLHNTVEFCVRDNPARFVDNLELFKTVDLAYVSSIISGLRDAWRSKKEFNWENVFNYIMEIISTSNFWEYKPNEDSFDYQQWTISVIAELINEGTRNDDNAFDPKFLNRAESILLIISENINPSYKSESDIITYTFNSTKGKIYEALFNYSLRYARLDTKNKIQLWKKSIKDHFIKKIIKSPEETPEIWVTLGRFFINLVYLDREWVFNNINSIFPSDNEKYWQYTMTSYLFFVNKIYKDIYCLLRDNGHYKKAIYSNFAKVSLNEDVKTSLMSHIGVAYLNGIESLNDIDSSINHVLQRKDPKQIEELIEYFWRSKNFIKNLSKDLVRNLWSKLYDILKNNRNNNNFHESISSISKWLSFFNEIDSEIYEWIKLSSTYVKKYYDEHFFIENLNRIVQTSPENVGLIYLNMLNRDIVPTYEEEDIRETVVSIFKAGFKDLGNKICNGYIEHGNLMLRDIFEEYNS